MQGNSEERSVRARRTIQDVPVSPLLVYFHLITVAAQIYNEARRTLP